MIGRFSELHQHGRPVIRIFSLNVLNDLLKLLNQALIERPLGRNEVTMEDLVLFLGELLLDLGDKERESRKYTHTWENKESRKYTHT